MAWFQLGKGTKKEEREDTKKIPDGKDSGAFGGKDSAEIKVLGSGCKACHTLYQNTQEAVTRMGRKEEVEYITDLQKVMTYGAMSMPALVVRGKVVSAGRVLSTSEIEGILQKSLAE